ncbi:pilus assembly PilX family protein [Ectothiorhodospira haloalkaliphila]|uniref:pilus assembly PilX family protein n=1 Tax=Ectothiorhodospira haloalkaliphila TaxID=421628 RepID=UPI003B75BA6B
MVGLVLLLVVTLLAVAGIQNTLMQERMSGNLHDRNVAFQASEAALREGEKWLNASIGNRVEAEGHDRLENPWSWEGEGKTGEWSWEGEGEPGGGAALAGKPAFYVNPPAFVRDPGDADAANPICDRYFAVYAHGVGGTISARVTLQGTVLPHSGGLVVCPAEQGQ